VAHNFPGSLAPSAALPFVNAAGVSKLMVAAGSSNFVINDVDGVDVSASLASMPATATQRTTAGAHWEDLAVLGGNIYATDSMGVNLYQLTSDGLPAAAPLSLEGATPYGIVGNPTNGKLYFGTPTGVATYDVLSAALALDNAATSTAPYEYRGVALSPNYQTFYAAVKDTAAMSIDNNVEGFNIIPGESVMVFQSSNVNDVKGVLAGTGCLADYIFVTAGAQILQISFRGVQAVVASDSTLNAAGSYLSFDPKDGSMLVAWTDGVYRIAPPSCGGFAGPTKFVADALPMGSQCLVNYDCSSQNCNAMGMCATNGYLGICQADSDCAGVTMNGFFCQLPPAFRPNFGNGEGGKKHHHDKKHGNGHFGFGDFAPGQNVWQGPGPNPALYGVCEINECIVNLGGCDTNAVCTPTGDRQRVCSCIPGYFGTGINGQCVNPCDVDNGGCNENADCNSISATDVQCTCQPTFFGTGVGDEGCVADPCDSNAACASGTGICTPGPCPTCYTCDCLDGFFKVPNWMSPAAQCAVDLCFDNGNGGPCPAFSECTPTVGDFSCTCNPGYTAGPLVMGNPSYCTPAPCPTLTPGTFLFPDIHSTMGTCAGAVTGESCFFGCSSGYKPKTSARATCIAGSTPGTAVFSFTPFQCEIDPDHHDDHHDDHPHAPWWCGTPPVSPCLPSAPWLAWKDGNAGTLQLRWIPLGVSPLGDVVTSLQILVSPHGGLKYTTSPIALPASAHEITITGLNDDEIYTFRLYALTGGHQVTGLPLTVSL